MAVAKLTNAQRRELGWAVINRIADFAEFSDELLPPELDGVDGVAIMAQLATWMKDIPSDYWDERLPRPPGYS